MTTSEEALRKEFLTWYQECGLEIEFDKVAAQHFENGFRFLTSKTTQAHQQGAREAKDKLRQAVELWMDTHERNQQEFETNDFIKFVTEEV